MPRKPWLKWDPADYQGDPRVKLLHPMAALIRYKEL